MPNELRKASFPVTQQEVSRLKQTATDAVNDLGSAASILAPFAKSRTEVPREHSLEEGRDHLDQAKGILGDLANSARDFASARPLMCIGVALTVGFLIGLSLRS